MSAPGQAPASRRAALLASLGFQEGGAGPELWAMTAFSLFLLLVGGLFYLGSRPGGTAPIFLYTVGRDLLVLLALLVLAFGALRSALRRPFLQRKRGYAFLCLALIIGVAPIPFPYPSSHEGHPSPIHFRLPVDGAWRVFWGGDTRAQNRLGGFLPDRRWALHLVREEEGSRWRNTEPTQPADSLAWGEPLVAAATGTVALVRDGIEDSSLTALRRDVPALGNLVVLEVAPSQYLFYAHLLAGSVEVREGERVEAGRPLARVGFSGAPTFTPEPHVAVHLADSLEESWGEAIPWRFYGYRADGEEVERGLPTGGLGEGGALVGQVVEQGP